MKLLVVAVGTRLPDWLNTGFAEYAKRMPRELPLELTEIKPEPRTTGKPVEAMMAAEAKRIEAALPSRCRRIALDEHGDALDTRALTQRLGQWQDEGDDVAFIIGGPDGLDPVLKQGAHERLRLSSLTLPHGLARVVLAEALYRAHSLQKGHPYHRD
ncbi:MAG: 23S rRNA (pseudouridine(1915)-N(3))-methyltransferase RlmH [Gammaproteobacteria bacterium]|nr:23S rRNA (pseudouridine(1915)-N(3))-methyltransferase RlmH [Rhodocyclaceae bacterium]MBU3907988.1 23S rRNA (pseudouridine(1915)-N(3))-methyltransferase RlmH [Gammaproteobacteria bacterium]MBU3990630.1 23S rRNA (pseudouridine(1915)-N(3))-methyltransferase RlmH [Gammaproteobacteria bacterium]MBU4006081.1 23S rRNA (pseudouridine(1915)-N(3))-methyltransferase RlmH [Gammaproteobacteria bacterium]MBU4022082.1 23S rRNA (pseudouridine(1915)-N(3))-methyltransferase RlmH [Gammaproteobacteria bacterium